MMQRSNKAMTTAGRRRRSVRAILARRRRGDGRYRRMVPPDFDHGGVAMSRVYDVYGAEWAERALFVCDDGDVVTTARFDDHFLVIEQWVPEGNDDLHDWWSEQSARRDRVISMTLGEDRIETGGAAEIAFDVDRRRLEGLEQRVLGLVRDGGLSGRSRQRRAMRGEVDVLSLVALTCRFGCGDDAVDQAA